MNVELSMRFIVVLLLLLAEPFENVFVIPFDMLLVTADKVLDNVLFDLVLSIAFGIRPLPFALSEFFFFFLFIFSCKQILRNASSSVCVRYLARRLSGDCSTITRPAIENRFLVSL